MNRILTAAQEFIAGIDSTAYRSSIPVEPALEQSALYWRSRCGHNQLEYNQLDLRRSLQGTSNIQVLPNRTQPFNPETVAWLELENTISKQLERLHAERASWNLEKYSSALKGGNS
jgi:hypothetical protein